MAVEQAPQPSGIRGFFSRPVAGIPLWGWAGILVVGVGVAWFFFWRKGASSSSTDTSTAGGLAIDPSSGLPYGTTGQGGLNPGGAFAGEQTYDPFANTNSLLQQILNQNQQNTNPPTTTTPGGLSGYDPSTRLYTLPSALSFSQIAALTGAKLSDIYYNQKNAAIRNVASKNGGINGGYLIPKGTQVYIAGLGGSGGTQVGNPPIGTQPGANGAKLPATLVA